MRQRMNRLIAWWWMCVMLSAITGCGSKTGLRVPQPTTYARTVASVCQCGMCGQQKFCIDRTTRVFTKWAPSTGCDPGAEDESTELSIFRNDGTQQTLHCV